MCFHMLEICLEQYLHVYLSGFKSGGLSSGCDVRTWRNKLRKLAYLFLHKPHTCFFAAMAFFFFSLPICKWREWTIRSMHAAAVPQRTIGKQKRKFRPERKRKRDCLPCCWSRTSDALVNFEHLRRMNKEILFLYFQYRMKGVGLFSLRAE